MIRQIVLFQGQDASGVNGLWETNGTAAGTFELTGINGVDVYGLAPNGFTVFNGKVLFVGDDSNGLEGLWLTDGTAAGTQELTAISGASPAGLFSNDQPPNFTVFNDEVLFDGTNTRSC